MRQPMSAITTHLNWLNEGDYDNCSLSFKAAGWEGAPKHVTVVTGATSPLALSLSLKEP